MSAESSAARQYDASGTCTDVFACARLLAAEEGSATAGAAARVTNHPPYCAQLFSPRSLPFGFHSAALSQYGRGFPVLFDINLDAGSALEWLAFIQVVCGLPDGAACPPPILHPAPSRLQLTLVSAWLSGCWRACSLQEGLFLDSRTQRLLAQVVTYNPELRLFSSAVVAFQFAKGGSVQVGGAGVCPRVQRLE